MEVSYININDRIMLDNIFSKSITIKASEEIIIILGDGKSMIIGCGEDPCGYTCFIEVNGSILCGRQEGEFWSNFDCRILNGTLLMDHMQAQLHIEINRESCIRISSVKE